MKIIKYTDDETYITDRGYWEDIDDKSKIGVGTSGEELTPLELEERQLSIHSRYPMMKEINSYMLLEGTSNPTTTTGAQGLAHIFLNTSSNELFSCSDATEDANVWVSLNNPHGTISCCVIHPPIRQSTAVVMTEAEIRHLIQYWVTSKI